MTSDARPDLESPAVSARNDISASRAPKRCSDRTQGERANARPVRESPHARRIRLLGELDALLNELDAALSDNSYAC
jgi:hypothetical protein